MEKTCEFCGAPRPMVYCQADAALLCLACDSKVHSANALFGRHSRTILCDSCTGKPACVRCLDHLLVLCQDCESRLHNNHRKLVIGSFTGCPEAKHFASLWGFDANQFEQPELTSCTQQNKKPTNNHQGGQNKSLIFHQILGLKNLQSSSSRNQREYVTSRTLLNESQEVQCCEQLNNELQSLKNPSQVLEAERFPSSISQLDHLSSTSSAGDPFWQCNKSPSETTNQFWSQNLQDLGMCQELGCFDDFNMPDVDVTFANFEDLLIGDPDLTCSLLQENDPMFSRIERASIMEAETEQDITLASSISTNKQVNQLDHVTRGLSRSMESSPELIKYACSARLSCSQLSAESSDTEFIDCANSSGPSHSLVELNGAEVEHGEGSTRMSKEKTKTNLHSKKTQLAPRKAKADMHKKIKSWCAKA